MGLPQFNKKCDIRWGSTGYPAILFNPPDVSNVDCELLPLGRGDGSEGQLISGSPLSLPRSRIILPKGTDVRDFRSQSFYDIITIIGYGPFRVFGVYDVGFGWPDEFRTALVQPANNSTGSGNPWVLPYPAGS